MSNSIYEPEDMRRVHQVKLDLMVAKNGGDNRTRKWVKIREEIIDYFNSIQNAHTAELHQQMKVLHERSKQGSLF